MKKLLYPLVFVLFVVSAVAAPAAWSIALNHQTKECAGYWAGDEFVYYELPNNWKAYNFDYESCIDDTCKVGNEIVKCTSCKVNTEIGTCYLHSGNEKECCEQLGYTFVSQNIGNPNIEKRDITSWGVLELILLLRQLVIPLIILVAIAFIILRIKTKSFIPFAKTHTRKGVVLGLLFGLLCFYGFPFCTGGQCGNPIRLALFVVSLPIYEVISLIQGSFGITPIEPTLKWLGVLVLNLVYFGIIGWIIGFVLQKSERKKVDSRRARTKVS